MDGLNEARDAWIRYVAIGLSMMLHGMLLFGYGGVVASQSEKVSPSVTRLTFLAPSPEPQALPDNIPEKPLVEPKPQPAPKIVKKAVARKAVVKKVIEKKVEQTQEKAVEKPVPVVAEQTMSASLAQIDEGIIRHETERYLTEVMAHIERHKWYPKAARRRRIEGTIHVRFILHTNGVITHLQVGNGSTVLRVAARQAVEKAMPMPKPPGTIHCPLACKFRMRFALDAM